MDFSLPALRQMVTSLALRWVGLPGKKGEASRDSEKKSEENGDDGVEKPDVERERQEEVDKLGENKSEEEKGVLARSEESEMLKTEPRSEIVKAAGKESDEEEEAADVVSEKLQTEEPKSEEGREMEVITLVEEGDATAQIMEKVLEDVWRSHQSCLEDSASEPEPLPKSNDTIGDIWIEMNRVAEEEMDRERDQLVEELIVDLEDDFEVIIAREESFEMIEEDSNANENLDGTLEDKGQVQAEPDLEDDFEAIIAREKSFEMIEEDGNANENKNLYESLEEEVQTEPDVHLECRAAGQECGTLESFEGLRQRKAPLVDLVDILGRKSERREHLKTAKLSVKLNIQNEALENIEDLELGIKGKEKSKKMKRIAKSSIFVAATKRKVDASIGQLFSSNGNEIRENANKKVKTEVSKQTKCGTNKQKRRVAWTRSATRVSEGGSEEKVIFMNLCIFL